MARSANVNWVGWQTNRVNVIAQKKEDVAKLVAEKGIAVRPMKMEISGVVVQITSGFQMQIRYVVMRMSLWDMAQKTDNAVIYCIHHT